MIYNNYTDLDESVSAIQHTCNFLPSNLVHFDFDLVQLSV